MMDDKYIKVEVPDYIVLAEARLERLGEDMQEIIEMVRDTISQASNERARALAENKSLIVQLEFVKRDRDAANKYCAELEAKNAELKKANSKLGKMFVDADKKYRDLAAENLRHKKPVLSKIKKFLKENRYADKQIS